MSPGTDDILKSINDLKSTQSKLINSVNGQNDHLKSLTSKFDVAKINWSIVTFHFLI